MTVALLTSALYYITPLILVVEGSCLVANPPLRLTFTFVAGLTLAVASGTFTLIGSDSVDAVTSGTKTRHCLALVHIYQKGDKTEKLMKGCNKGSSDY